MEQKRKKERERAILEGALTAARDRGGEGRRNADRIRGQYLEREGESESPDFVIRMTPKASSKADHLIGIEHFRVDHFCKANKKGGHMDSIPAREQRQIEALQQSWNPNDSEEIPDAVFECVGNIIGRSLAVRRNAFFDNFVTSFSQGLEKHLGKVERYRENVANLALNDEEVQLAFLVEIHTDFSGLFFNNGNHVARVQKGFMPLFSEVAELLETAAKHVDYLIMCFCPAQIDEIVDCWILRCESLRKSLERHKEPIVEYYGENKRTPSRKDITLIPHMRKGKEDLHFSYDEQGRELNPETKLSLCLADLPAALESKKQNHPFVATMTMQLILDLLGDVIMEAGFRSGISMIDIVRYRSLISDGEFSRRMKTFERKYFPDYQEY